MSKWESLYFEPEQPTSFTWRKPLEEASGSKEGVQDWLDSQLTYTLHKPARRRFKRNPIYAPAPGFLAQADLADMTSLSRSNHGACYILVYIDCFSRYASAVSLKSKKQGEVARGFREIYKRRHPCAHLQTDNGKEFIAKQVQKLADEYHYRHYFTFNKDIKAAIAERFIRTLKSKIFKYMTSKGTRKYVDILQALVASYNSQMHRSIGMPPSAVTPDNAGEVHFRLYGVVDARERILARRDANAEPQTIPIGASVRKRYELSAMEKGYFPNWSDKVYRVIQFIKGRPRSMYRIADFFGRTLKQRFYKEDLQVIKGDPKYRIERIIRRDRRKGLVLVRWLNHEPEYDTWIPESSIESNR